MALAGEKSKGFSKKIGFSRFSVLAFCPDKDKLEQLYGSPQEKDPVYLGEKEGVTTMNVSIFMKEEKTGSIFNHIIFLKDKEVESKDGNKKQYINELGRTSWADDESNLSEKFVAHPYHVARAGEADLVAFLDAWLDIDRKRPYSLDIDWKRLMGGSVKELDDLLATELPREKGVFGMAVVRVVGDEMKEYQGLYRRVLPEYAIKFFNTVYAKNKFNEEYLELLKTRKEASKTTKEYLNNYESFLAEITDREHGCKDIYFLGPIKDYTGEALVSSNEPISEGEADY